VVRGVLTETLTTHDGWEVCAALENGEQAVMKAGELSPDLIILDLAMPVMDGLTATREIAKILPSVPVVIYTLHNAAWLQLEAQKAGARAVVSKPEVLRLIDVAEDLLREKSSAQSLIGFPPAPDVSLEQNGPTHSASVPEEPATGFQAAAPPIESE
jgi:two-component system chemotaxis response regulator CheY